MCVFAFVFSLLGLRENESTRCGVAGIAAERERNGDNSVFSKGEYGRCGWIEEAEESEGTAGI